MNDVKLNPQEHSDPEEKDSIDLTTGAWSFVYYLAP